MKNLSLLVWLSQLGLSVATPLTGFILAGAWLHNRFDLGIWIVIAGAVTGIVCAIACFCNSLKAMEQIASGKTNEKPPLSFNDHD